jgi:hypothetical protein
VNTIAAHIQHSKGQRYRWPLIWSVVVTSLIVWGSHAHLERYITPQRGLGYWLGITGGSMMLLLLIYSARKRYSWLRWMGGIPEWFQIHMTLGVLGPLLILFHSNFRLGATNSNVALICMLVVAGSGVVGRYIYTRLHARMDGHEDTLEQLKSVGERLRSHTTSIQFLPGLLESIEGIEQRLIRPTRNPVGRFLHLFTGGIRCAVARWQARREITRAIQYARRHDRVIAANAQRIAMVAYRYADRRFEAGRRMQEFKLYSRIFSLWHVLHIPLFFMLLIAGIVHVIAINVY